MLLQVVCNSQRNEIRTNSLFSACFGCFNLPLMQYRAVDWDYAALKPGFKPVPNVMFVEFHENQPKDHVKCFEIESFQTFFETAPNVFLTYCLH